MRKCCSQCFVECPHWHWGLKIYSTTILNIIGKICRLGFNVSIYYHYWISFILPHLPTETLLIWSFTISLCFGSLTACHLILNCVFDLMLASLWRTMVLDHIVQCSLEHCSNAADSYERHHSYSLWHLCLSFWREETMLGGDLLRTLSSKAMGSLSIRWKHHKEKQGKKKEKKKVSEWERERLSVVRLDCGFIF